MKLSRIYKDKTKKWHDQRVLRKEFKVRKLVILYYSRLRLLPGKLRSRWSGPYTVITTSPFGVVTLRIDSRNEFKVDGQRPKHYLGNVINEDNLKVELLKRLLKKEYIAAKSS